jgi:hypothetical protein
MVGIGGSDMNEDGTKSEISAQCLALEVFVVLLCRSLARVSPELGGAIRNAFAEAADQIENLGFLLGDTESARHLISGAQIIDKMQTAAVGVHTNEIPL